MAVKVAVTRFNERNNSLKKALEQIGTIDDLNTPKRNVVIKVGVFNHESQNHTSVDVVRAIINSFDKAPKIYIAESDNYIGTAPERLQIWKELFTDRVVPFNLSEDTNVRKAKVADEETGLSHILFKPNVFVSTHILRTYEKGSILKNLLGLIPDRKKARFHKKLDPALLDMCEAVGGIDLSVLDGTYLYHGVSSNPHAGPNGNRQRTATGIVLVGRNPVAVETVGLAIVGLKPEKMSIIQQAVKRGLGEGNINKIEIIGDTLENLKKEATAALKSFKKKRPKGPQTWGGHSSQMLKELTSEGFFKLPNKRTISEVVRAYEAKGLKSQGKETKIAAALARKVKKGTLRSDTSPQGRLYWTE